MLYEVITYRFEDIAPMNRIGHVRCPVLLAHGTHDRVVPISDMQLIEANAGHQQTVRVIAVEEATHDSVERFQQHADLLLDFIRQQLPMKQDKGVSYNFV